MRASHQPQEGEAVGWTATVPTRTRTAPLGSGGSEGNVSNNDRDSRRTDGGRGLGRGRSTTLPDVVSIRGANPPPRCSEEDRQLSGIGVGRSWSTPRTPALGIFTGGGYATKEASYPPASTKFRDPTVSALAYKVMSPPAVAALPGDVATPRIDRRLALLRPSSNTGTSGS